MPQEIVYLSRGDVESIDLGMAEIIDRVTFALAERGHGRSAMPPKPALHPGEPGTDNFLHAMPAYLPGLPAVGIKWVGGYPNNFTRGLPYISGLLILNHPDTGLPIAVMDCTWITAMRTAAATAVASRHLAVRNPHVLGILGAGVQGRTNLQILMVVHPNLQEVQVYDVRPENTRAYIREMQESFPGLGFSAASTPREAVSGADIIVTAGPILRQPRPVIEPGWFAAGALGVALDYDSYWLPETMRAADLFITDDRSQLLHTRSEGYFKDVPEIDADLCEICAGLKPGRQTPKQRILCMNLGLAIHDIATASRILELAQEKGIGRSLPL